MATTSPLARRAVLIVETSNDANDIYKQQRDNQIDEPGTLLAHTLTRPENPDDGQCQSFLSTLGWSSLGTARWERQPAP